MSTQLYILLMVIGFVAAFIQGLSGFGFPLLAVPLFSFFLPIQVAVPITTVLGVAVNLVLVREVPNICPRLRELLLMVGASILFIPLGVWCLKYMETAYIKIFIGVVALVCTWFLFRGLSLTVKKPTVWSAAIGGVCGFLNGLANLAGPVLILYLNNLKLEKKVFRAFTIIMFSAMGLVTTATAAASGLVTRQVLLSILILLPLIFLGSWVGGKFSTRVNDAFFRKLTLGILACTSVSVIISGLTAL